MRQRVAPREYKNDNAQVVEMKHQWQALSFPFQPPNIKLNQNLMEKDVLPHDQKYNTL